MNLLARQSEAFQRGLFIFVIGLAVLAVGSAVLLWLVIRRGPAQEDAARRIVRNSVGPLVIQLGLRAIDFVFAKVLFTLLPKDEVGQYELAALLVSLILATMADWGLTVWLTREVARDRQSLGRVFGTTVLVRWGLTLLLLPLAALVIASYAGLNAADLIGSALAPQTIQLIAILMLTLLPGAWASAVTAVFLAHEQPVAPALANLLNNSVSTLLRTALVLLGLGILGVAWGALIATALNAGVFAWLLLRRWGWPGWSWNGRLARTMLGAAWPLMLNGLLVAVFFRFDVFIIQAAQGEIAVANYGAAYRYASLALVLPPIVVNALFPLFARQALSDRAALLRGYRLTLRLLLLLALPLATVLTVLAPYAIRLLASEEYVSAAAPVLTILVWFIPLSYVNGVAQYVLIALGRQAMITRAFLVTMIFNIVANLVAIPRWGINAAAAVTVLSELVLYLPLARVLREELGAAPLGQLLWRPLLASCAAGAVLLLLSGSPIVAAVVGMSVYFLALWALQTFTAEDRALIARLLGKTPRRPLNYEL